MGMDHERRQGTMRIQRGQRIYLLGRDAIEIMDHERRQGTMRFQRGQRIYLLGCGFTLPLTLLVNYRDGGWKDRCTLR